MGRIRTLLNGPPKKAIALSQDFVDRLAEKRTETGELDEAVQSYKYLVIGGNGFTGTYVARELIGRGAPLVRILSRSQPSKEKIVDGAEYVKGSMTSPENLKNALQGIDVVFQLAAYKGSPPFGYKNKSSWKVAEQINVEGMKMVTEISKNAGVKLLLYTSSVDTVFNVEGHDNIREAETKYVTSINGRDPCHYQRSKLMAEKYVLAADDPNGMRTVAIRPGGIYGPQEEYALPKMLSAGWKTGRHFIKLGTSNFKYKKPLQDFSFAPNLAFAHSLIVNQIHNDPNKVGGKAYFVHDDNPMCVANGEMFEPVLKACRIKRAPIIPVSAFLLRKYGAFNESVGFKKPALTVHEAMKATTHHTHSIQSAKEDFGYYPIFPHEEGWMYTAQDFKARMEQI